MSETIERTDARDPYRDFCLWDYKPVAPTFGKLRSASLLWQSFEVLGAPPALRQIVEAIRAEIGPFRTVWGVKERGGEFSWELYFYDYARLARDVSIERILRTIAPFAPSGLQLSPARPYFMFSIDIDAQLGRGERPVDELSVYLGNPDGTVSSGLCYQLSAAGLRLDNLYYFYDAHRDREQIEGKIAASAHLDLTKIDMAEVLWPELADCGILVVANKKTNDGVYFSRITIDQLLFFVERLGYPSSIHHFLRSNRAALDHMLYDVGIDYRMRDGRIEVIKSAYYGVV